jgi:hypothetical protein
MPSMPSKKPAMMPSKPAAAPMAADNDHDLDDGGGIPPEAVSYRSADQKYPDGHVAQSTDNCIDNQAEWQEAKQERQ